jgi:hypothetical protein
MQEKKREGGKGYAEYVQMASGEGDERTGEIDQANFQRAGDIEEHGQTISERCVSPSFQRA